MSDSPGTRVPTLSWTIATGRSWPFGDRTTAIRDEVSACFLSQRDAVYRYLVYARGCTPSDAEEITQEAFLRLHAALLKGTHVADLRQWTYAVARNLATDLQRHQRYERPSLGDLSAVIDASAGDVPNCEEELYRRQREAALTRALGELSPIERECLHLRAAGASLRDTGRIVGRKMKTVSEIVCRAIRRLQATIPPPPIKDR